MPDHFIVAPGDEQGVAEALAGEVINVEPVCPICRHVGAIRVDEHRETRERFDIDCYLTWCAAHGVTSAAKRYADMPPHHAVRSPDGVGFVSAYRTLGVRCRSCGYMSAPSAFYRPAGP